MECDGRDSPGPGRSDAGRGRRERDRTRTGRVKPADRPRVELGCRGALIRAHAFIKILYTYIIIIAGIKKIYVYIHIPATMPRLDQ